MRKLNLIWLALLFVGFMAACDDKEEISLSVTEQLTGVWQGDSAVSQTEFNGMAIDSLSQSIAIDSILLTLNADMSYALSVGSMSYNGTWSLANNDTEILIDDFDQYTDIIPDSIDADIDYVLKIAKLEENRFEILSETEISILIPGTDFPVLLGINTNMSFNRKE